MVSRPARTPVTGATLTLRQADTDDLTYVRTLLERNDLPTADVDSTPGSFYVGYDDDGRRVAVGGVEVRGADGLLRSVVVEQSARGEGNGTTLCAALEERAAAEGVATLYLLTTTADAFFARRGYVEVDRGTVSAAIRETPEFAELCPHSATCMRKSL